MEIKIAEKEIAETIIGELRRHNVIGEPKSITIIYNSESEDILYTVKEVAKIIRSNPAYVYSVIKAGLLPVLKLGGMKIRRTALMEFCKKYEGYDLTDPYNFKRLEFNSQISE